MNFAHLEAHKTQAILPLLLPIVLGFLAFHASECMGAELDQAPSDARELEKGELILARLIAMSIKGDSHPSEDLSKQSTFQESRRRDFDEQLEDLADWMDHSPKLAAKLLADGIANSLARIARDRRRNPKLYSKIEQRYGVPMDERTVAPRPMRLQTDDVRFRHVWEYFLIVPPTTSVKIMGRRPIQALVANGDPASLPVLVFEFKTQCVKDFGGPLNQVGYGSVDLFEAIPSMRTTEALDAAFECLDTVERLSMVEQEPLRMLRTGTTPEGRPTTFEIQSFRELLTHILTARGQNLIGEDWQAVLKKYPSTKLSEKNRLLVSKVLAGYQNEEGRTTD